MRDRGVESRGVESRGVESRGVESRGVESKGVECEGVRECVREGDPARKTMKRRYEKTAGRRAKNQSFKSGIWKSGCHANG